MFELIITMLLISVLAIYATAKLGGSAGFDEFAYQARLISTLRNMQIRAMNDTRANYCFQVNFDNANEAFGPPTLVYDTPAPTCSASIDVNNQLSGVNRSRYIHMYALSAETAEDGIDLDARNSAGDPISYVGFDPLGMPLTSDAGNDNCATGCTISFSTIVTTALVCVESQGYIHAGSCNG